MLMENTLNFILSENIFISPSFLKGSFTVQNSGLTIFFFLSEHYKDSLLFSGLQCL